MITRDNLYGIVIWYHPSSDNIAALESYVHEVNTLIIIDNSPNDNSELLQDIKHKNIIYQPNCENRGIATALNQGCRMAMESGATWVLTMDQDSRFSIDSVSKYVEVANAYPDFDKTALFSPVHYYDNEAKNKRKERTAYTVERSVMTSGNLLNLKAYADIKGFYDELFIDLVDDEFCYRLTQKGYQVVMINTIYLKHYLGDASLSISFLGLKKVVDDHSPIRRYYITRNTLYMADLHPSYKKYFRGRFRKHFKRVLLYDHHQKWTKLRYMFRGWRDYKRGIMGSYTTCS